MARILLIKSRFTTPDNQSIVPPLGIMYLASVLRAEGHEVRLIDTAFPERPFGDVGGALRDFRPDVVGISAITIEAAPMHALASTVKRHREDLPVVVGGPHASSYPETILKDPNIDYLCLGEGEVSFPRLVERLADGRLPSDLPGLAYRGPRGVVRTEPVAPISDLDSMPFPAWDLIDLPAYATRKSMSTVGLRRYMTLFTSRGCPYRCTYCHENFGKAFRARSPENVVREMEVLVREWGVRDFEIVDDIFNWDLHRAKDIFRRIAALPALTIHFPNGLRSDQLDDEFLVLAREAGLRYLAVAVETVSPRLQRLSKKNLKVERVRRVIDRAVDLGIFVRGFFMLGFPTETREEMEATVRFAVESRLHEALFFIVTPFGGTTLGRQAGVNGGLAGARFSDLDYFRGDYNLSAVPKEEVFHLQRRAYRLFYFRPGRVWRILLAHPQRRQLPRWAWMVLRKVLVRGRGNSARPGFLEEIPPVLLQSAGWRQVALQE